MPKDYYSMYRWWLLNRWCASCRTMITLKRADTEFCSRRCRDRSRRQHARAERRLLSLLEEDDWLYVTCGGCYEPLPRFRRPNMRYCSHACRQRAYRERRKAEALM
jgi:hypothetical protein